jgi:hypothetical protein
LPDDVEVMAVEMDGMNDRDDSFGDEEVHPFACCRDLQLVLCGRET